MIFEGFGSVQEVEELLNTAIKEYKKKNKKVL